MYVFDTLAPVFLFVILGALLRSTSFLPRDFFLGCNKLVFYLGLPAFLFSKIVSTDFDISSSAKIFYVLVITMVLSIGFAYITAFITKVPRSSYSAFVQVAFRGNTALVGIPVIVYALSGTADESMVNIAIVALAPAIPIWNVVSLLLLVAHGEKKNKLFSLNITRRIVSNPLVIACVAGLVVAGIDLELPKFIVVSCSKLGQMTLPLALISIGASLSLSRLKGKISIAIVASLVKIIICPALGFLCCYLLDMSDVETFIALIYCASPTAVSAYVMTEQMGGDEDVAGSGIVLSTLFASIPLIVIVAVYGIV